MRQFISLSVAILVLAGVRARAGEPEPGADWPMFRGGPALLGVAVQFCLAHCVQRIGEDERLVVVVFEVHRSPFQGDDIHLGFGALCRLQVSLDRLIE